MTNIDVGTGHTEWIQTVNKHKHMVTWNTSTRTPTVQKDNSRQIIHGCKQRSNTRWWWRHVWQVLLARPFIDWSTVVTQPPRLAKYQVTVDDTVLVLFTLISKSWMTHADRSWYNEHRWHVWLKRFTACNGYTNWLHKTPLLGMKTNIPF